MPSPLWITYAWADNADGDFDFLVQQLGAHAIPARFDKIALIPGQKLWAQIAERISHDPLSGWAYLLTSSSLASQACKEELSYALQRALESKGDTFPLIGLLHGVSIRDVPLALRVRLCINLHGPDWIEEVRAAVSARPPTRSPTDADEYVLKLHNPYLGQASKHAIEIRPRFGELRYWRFAFPVTGPQPTSWGTGPANGGGIGGVKTSVIQGESPDIGGTPMKIMGAGDPLSASTSAYAIFEHILPTCFFFGVAYEAFGPPSRGRIYPLGRV